MKSYLGWPIQLSPFLKVPEAHMTLKYLGDAPVTQAEIKSRLEGQLLELQIGTKVTWSPEIFMGLTCVMVFSGLNEALWKTREAVNDLRVDEFPEWRPHVTLPKDAWEGIRQNNIPPWSVIRSIGQLTLFLDNKPSARFR